ncbi:hypothetical protein DDB_G0285611 [Dictyostelium discoideum AX4]|uniref:Uncharacterized protein n=1 Tax=Dictyostelium discoideum TaxID=44689 RepID=Q54MY2_DICDI|nr:hypothetical protein DDB_G0285611 [Dictyostelium discoideum AX4]EAL64643.1 hypothetical protein DDB_G0285611 [Dictyostelium discoideum AX4]|eukprot:XP_638161.1 hypothetical protein DDB_G0285611 [Dictyostelium discoideum AX4]
MFPGQERREIEICVAKVGELYSFLGVSKTSTTKEITFEFLRIKNKLGIEGDEINNLEMDKLKKNYYEPSLLSYNILTNPIARSMYDNEYYEIALLLSEINNNNKKKKKKIFIYQLLSNTLDLILVNMSKKGNQSILKMAEMIYERNGPTSFFIGGAYNLCGAIIHSKLICNPINAIILMLVGEESEKIMINSDGILSAITYYPIRFIIDCLFLSPFTTSPIKVINDIILGRDGSAVGDSESSNLFYSFTSSISILLLKKLIDISIIKIDKIILENVKKNNNNNSNESKFWKYCEIIYCNSITQGILRASLLHPLQIIRLQYPYEFVESYLQGTPIPEVIGPISMAIKVYNQQGFSKFFNGFSLAIPFYIIRSISTRISPPRNLNLYSD